MTPIRSPPVGAAVEEAISLSLPSAHSVSLLGPPFNVSPFPMTPNRLLLVVSVSETESPTDQIVSLPVVAAGQQAVVVADRPR